MKFWDAFKFYLQSVPDRWGGRYIAPTEPVAAWGTGIAFQVDHSLEVRREAARAALGPIPSVARKTPRLILDEVSFQVATIPDDEYYGPVG